MNIKTAQTTLYFTLAVMAFGSAHADEFADVSKLAKAGKVVDALAKTNEYLKKHPEDPQMRFMKGVLLTEQNKSEEAIAVFTKLTEDYKDLPEPYNNLAVLYAASGQYDKARMALEKAIRTNPSYQTAYENLGDIYGKMASQAYDKAIALGAAPAVPVKSNLTLLRTFSTSTGGKIVAPETSVASAAPPAARPAAQPPLISQLPPQDAAKANAPQRIPALSVTPPAPAPKVVAATPAPVAAKPLPTPAPAPAPVKVAAAAAPVPAPMKAAAAAAPVPAPVKMAATPAATSAALAKTPATPTAPAPAALATAAAPAKATAAPAVVAPATGTVAAAPPAPSKAAAAAPDKATVAQAAPAQTKAAVPAKAEAAKPDTADRDAVLAQVHAWSKAWAAQNVNAYLGYYSQQFEPPKGMTRKAWADERRARIEGKGRIRVEVAAPEVVVNGNTAKVTFRQTYESDRLTARSRKTLVMVKHDGKWQIKQEISGN
jgi:Flp pilus assembly protein TadD